MAGYLAILAAMLGWLMGNVAAVTDQEFQDMKNQLHNVVSEVHDLHVLVEKQFMEIGRQASEIECQVSEIGRQAAIINRLESSINTNEKQFSVDDKELVRNATIEERVSLLELQVSDLDEDVNELEGYVNFLFDETVIQDERLFSLEQENIEINDQLDDVDDDIESLQETTLSLDFRVTVLEETGGSGGNISISELEERMETLEGTVNDHETRITTTEGNVEDLEGSSANHEVRLTAAEENIQGLQMVDINHDARITALEENGRGTYENETIAFHAVLTSYYTIPDEWNVDFNKILVNEGNGYNSTSGRFKVPSGGGGTYYFSTYLLVEYGEFAFFDITLNHVVICTAYGDHDYGRTNDAAQATCSAIVNVVEGDEVTVVLQGSNDDTPLYDHTGYYMNGFNGFRL